MATEAEIVQAARRLFARNGYARTSVADVAREAGVALQTVYDRVGSKAALVRRMNDLVDAESGVAELEARMSASTDPRELLGLCVQLTRQVAERCGDIIAAVNVAALAEPAIDGVLAEGRRRHISGTGRVASVLEAMGALQDGVDAESAGRLLATLTYNDSYLMLTRDFGLSFDQAQAWLEGRLAAALLEPPGP
jgi:AcrR family transcriptional regulator